VVDRDLILRKLADLDQYVSQVSDYRAVTVEEYRRDWKTQRIVERTLQIAVEVCVDIATHVIADRALKVPTTYADAFDILADAGLLEPALRDAMIRMTQVRNILVHQYAAVDPVIVVRILRETLQDFTRFRAAALTWL